MKKALSYVFVAIYFVSFDVAVAANTSVDKNYADVFDVKESVESLEKRLERLENKSNDRVTRPNLFNPGLTAFGNFLTCGGQGYPKMAHGLCAEPFVMRELELDLRASVDPWADAVMILAIEPVHSHGHDSDEDEDEHGHGGHGDSHGQKFSIEIEEAYVVLKKWPLVDDAPLGIQLKAGRFRVPFGRFNQIHLHDLPQATMPLSMQAFLGVHGLIRTGFSAQVLLPTPGENNSMNLTMQILTSGSMPFSTEETTQIPAGLVHWSWFWDLLPGHDFEVGLSGYVQAVKNNHFPLQVYGIDANYKWRPFVRGDKKSFLLGGEFFIAPMISSTSGDGEHGHAHGHDHDHEAHDHDHEAHDHDHARDIKLGFGGFAFAQYQFNQNVYLGVRYDYRDARASGGDHGHAIGAFLTYYTTEFLRFRLGYELVTDHGYKNVSNNGMLEINFIFGSHPVEPYWVNR